MSTMDEAASAADDLGSVDPDVAPGAEPLVDSSPVPLLLLLVWRLCRLLIEKGLGTRGGICFRPRIWVNIMFGTQYKWI